MIYTSYYAKINTLPNDIEPIAISIGVPNWYTGKTYKKLAKKLILLNEKGV